MTQLFCGEYLFFNLFWNFTSKKSSAFHQKQTCILLLESLEAHPPLLRKSQKESLTLSYLFIFERRKAEISHNRILFKNKLLHCESQRISVMTAATSRKTHLHTIMISCCQGDNIFVTFQTMEFFCFWRNGEFTFFQRCLRSLYSVPTSQMVKSFGLGSSSLAIPFALSKIK